MTSGGGPFVPKSLSSSYHLTQEYYVSLFPDNDKTVAIITYNCEDLYDNITNKYIYKTQIDSRYNDIVKKVKEFMK